MFLWLEKAMMHNLDNIARTVFANNNADYHIALHYDSTSSNKGAFYISVPNTTNIEVCILFQRIGRNTII